MEGLSGGVAGPRFGSSTVIRAAALVFLLAAPSLDHKLALIESNRLKPGARVVTTAAEWNAWVADQVPPGVTRTRIDLGENRVTASANIDFLKIDRAAGNTPNWFLASILQGDRPVTVTARIQSANGRARVDVERVQIAGVAVEGRALDFLIHEYVIPRYPQAKVSQWFPLDYRMDHFEIHPSGCTIVLR